MPALWHFRPQMNLKLEIPQPRLEVFVRSASFDLQLIRSILGVYSISLVTFTTPSTKRYLFDFVDCLLLVFAVG